MFPCLLPVWLSRLHIMQIHPQTKLVDTEYQTKNGRGLKIPKNRESFDISLAICNFGGFSSLLKGWLHKAGGPRATKADGRMLVIYIP